ncbi:hypothetical protein CERSUDRAFT_34275, partial [Gelatoporia subvermispora B]
MSSGLPPVLHPSNEDIRLLLAAQVHIGTRNVESQMTPYIWKRRSDGIFILNIGKTWEKLVLAARAIVAILDNRDVCALSARPYTRRALLKYAQSTGADSITGRFIPGTFTNYAVPSYKEPRVIVSADPRTDYQAIREASHANIPVIGFCDSDTPLKFIDITIPANNKSPHAIGLMWWLLAREVLRLRGAIPRSDDGWNVVADTFFYLDPKHLPSSSSQQEQDVVELVVADGRSIGGKEDQWLAKTCPRDTLDWSAESVA